MSRTTTTMRTRLVASLTGCIAGLISLTASAQFSSFWIDESTDFTGNGCQNSDLNNVGGPLDTALRTDFWFGDYWLNPDAWPQDFLESCSSTFGSGGLDNVAMDARYLAVYAGHGNTGRLQYGFQNSGRCNVNLSTNSRLGSMNGSQAGFVMYLTSCTLRVENTTTYANAQWLRQQFGYHNSPSIHSQSPAGWWQRLWTQSPTSNKTQWLDTMEFDIDGDEDNSPVVVSHGSTASQAASVRDTANLITGPWYSNGPRSGGPACGAGQPAFFYNVVRRNNGSTAACLTN